MNGKKNNNSPPNLSPIFSTYPKKSWTIKLIRQHRPDLRRLMPSNGERDWQKFVEWLVGDGCKEYPALAEDREFRAYLKEVEPGDCVSRLQRLIYCYREDVRMTFALPHQRIEFEDWFFNHGIQEHALWPLLSSAEKDRLLQRSRYRYRDTEQRESLSFRQRPFGVNLIGYAFGQLGIGEDVRMAGRALLAAGVPFTILNFPPGQDIPQDDFSMQNHVAKAGPYAINIFCLTAEEHGRYFLEHGKKQLSGRFNIGYWPWELGKWPQEWEEITQLVNEVWVSSQHTYDALAPVCPVTTKRMPMAVELGSISNKGRRAFELSNSALLFCFSFDLASYVHRKNPRACVEAFSRAFPNDDHGISREEVGLVVKAHGPTKRDDEWEELKGLASKDERIYVIEETLSSPDLLAFYKCCDCFLSLHRAEGFGRGIAEALQLGLRVITTGYSGNMDFCETPEVDLVDYKLIGVEEGQYPFGAGQVWADPDINHAARLMRKLFSARCNTAGSKKRGGFAREWPEFSAKIVGERYRKRLEAIREQHQLEDRIVDANNWIFPS